MLPVNRLEEHTKDDQADLVKLLSFVSPEYSVLAASTDSLPAQPVGTQMKAASAGSSPRPVGKQTRVTSLVLSGCICVFFTGSQTTRYNECFTLEYRRCNKFSRVFSGTVTRQNVRKVKFSKIKCFSSV